MGSPTIDFSKYESQAPAPQIDFSKYESKPAEQSAPEKPGFGTRFAQAMGLPSSVDEAMDFVKHAYTHPWEVTPAGIIFGLNKGAATAAAQRVKEGASDAVQAVKDYRQGGVPLSSTAGRVGYDALHAGLQGPGAALDTAGQDIVGKNYAGAAGGITGAVTQAAAPELLERTKANMPAVKQGLTNAAAKGASGALNAIPAEGTLPRMALGYIPKFEHTVKVLNQISEWAAANKVNLPPEIQSDIEAISKPYGLKGNQITDAVTVTPRKILGPERQLPAPVEQPASAAPVAPAAPPTTAKVLKDAGVTQAMKDAGVAAPSASMRPVRPGTTPQLIPRDDVAFPPNLSGQDAALMQLTKQNINELRFIARQRGLPVSAQDTHTDLIGKIHDSMKPEEVNAFQQASANSQVKPSKFPENNAMAQALNDAANLLQQNKGNPYEVASLRSAASTIVQHPQAISQVDLTATKIRGIDKRIGKRINEFFAGQNETAPNQAPVVPAPNSDLSDLLQRSIEQARAARGSK